MYPYVALRCPTYRENSHANHTWHQHLARTRLFSSSGSAFPVGSIPIARSTFESLIDPQQIWDRLPKFTPGSGEEREYAGSYFSDELDAVYRVEGKGGSLVLKRFKYPGQALTPVIRDLFSFRLEPPSQAGVIEFMRDSSGHLSGMTLTTRRVRHLKFSRQRQDSEAPAAR
jgi:hypothetical protein